MTSPTTDEHDVIVTEIDGENALVVAPVIREDYPHVVREGLARRRTVQAGGQCPCGARMQLPNRAARRQAARTGQVARARAEHAADCPAIDANLHRAMRGAA